VFTPDELDAMWQQRVPCPQLATYYFFSAMLHYIKQVVCPLMLILLLLVIAPPTAKIQVEEFKTAGISIPTDFDPKTRKSFTLSPPEAAGHCGTLGILPLALKLPPNPIVLVQTKVQWHHKQPVPRCHYCP